jgi:outer membrane protein assembly factor BamB
MNSHKALKALLCLYLYLALLTLHWPVPETLSPSAMSAFSDIDALSTQLQLHWIHELPPQQPAWPDQPLLQTDAAPQPVVHGKTVYIASARTDSITAYEAASGAELWRFNCNGPIRFAPTVWKDRLYFGSDDGYLYCLDTAVMPAGQRLVWKLRGGPSDRYVLGNERLISTWPVRGSPVVVSEPEGVGREGTVYFAAGIWPFMGVFLHAVDARTKAEVWTNDGDSSTFIRQPHNTEAFAGIAPQGSLVVAGDRLLVPGGRSIPACYDRHTGKLLHYRLAENSKRGGGPTIDVHGSVFLNGVGVFDLETGACVGSVGEHTVGRGGILFSWSGAECQTLDVRKAVPRTATEASAKKSLLRPEWSPTKLGQAAMPRIDALIQAGSRLVAGAQGQILIYDLPLLPGRPTPSWRARIEGRPVHLVSSGGRLFVTTREGRLYCFGDGSPPPANEEDAVAASSLAAQAQEADAAAAQARELLDQTGVRDGYGIVWGAGSGRLVMELLAQSRLRLIVIEPDEDMADALRVRLTAARLYGERAAVVIADPETVQLPPYLASLMASEDLSAAGITPGPDFLRRAFASLRPFGGVACLPLPEGRRPELVDPVTLPQARIRTSGDWVLVSREGKLPGSANWTHEHGDAANTRVAPDTLVKAPLGMLWFGGPSNDAVLPRHGHGPQPQVIDGRAIIEGVDQLRAIDIYTGRLLWEVRLPGLGKVFDNLAHQAGANACGSNYVSLSDGVYVLHESRILRLDPATGRELARFPMPRLPGVKETLAWTYLNVCGDYVIGAANPPVSDPKLRNKTPSSSQYVLVLNRHDGRLLWSRAARYGFRHNTLCAGRGRLYAIDCSSPDFRMLFKRKPDDQPPPSMLLAWNLKTGKDVWNSKTNVFGTWLSYSEQHDVLVESGRVTRDSLTDEPRGMRAYRADTGKVLWFQKDYLGPAMIHGDRILKDGSACDLLTGAPYRRPDPITGEMTEWTWSRTYGCNTPSASEHLLTFRSGAAGFYDLCNEGGTGNIGGFRSGCTNNLIVAGGVLCAPDYTRTCTCSYQNQTSLALVPESDVELWTFQGTKEVKGVVKRVGVLLGAPGNRKADNGTLWLEYPSVGGPSPRLAVKVEPSGVEYFRRHSSQIEGVGPTWLAASGAKNLRSLTVPLAGPKDKPRLYTVRLVFVEPDNLAVGRRIFDVALQGRTVYEGLDVRSEAGGANRLLIKEFRGIEVGAAMTVRLTPAADSAAPVLCGVEVAAEEARAGLP